MILMPLNLFHISFHDRFTYQFQNISVTKNINKDKRHANTMKTFISAKIYVH